MTHIIYLIENEINNKIYVGMTCESLKRRFANHKRNAEEEKDSMPLHYAMRKYGREAFSIHPLQNADDKKRAQVLEKHWIDILDTYRGSHGYNATIGGECLTGEDNPRYGKSHSEETKQKISRANQGRSFSEEHRKNLSKSQKGRTLTEETKEKISQASKGRSHSEETKQKLRDMNKGEKSHRAKLTKQEASEVKWLSINSDMTQKEIGNEYDICSYQVSAIKTEKNWSHIDPQKPHRQALVESFV